MSTFRQHKQWLMQIFATEDWQLQIQKFCSDALAAKQLVNALLALLPRPDQHWQAIWSLGYTVSVIAQTDMDIARIIFRRLMWSMNEESGNLGWGIPETMGAILSACAPLEKEYAKIVLSYIRETGGDDNFIEYAPLRKGVYWAAGAMASKYPQTVQKIAPQLLQGLEDEHIESRGLCLWALLRLYKAADTTLQHKLRKMLEPTHAITALTNLGAEEFPLTLLQDDHIIHIDVQSLAAELLALISTVSTKT